MEKTKEYYLALLRNVNDKEGRLPKKSDFSEEDVNKIKGIFGPWPWALAEAGLVRSKQEDRIAKNREKRKNRKTEK